jgi:hypothetical protein
MLFDRRESTARPCDDDVASELPVLGLARAAAAGIALIDQFVAFGLFTSHTGGATMPRQRKMQQTRARPRASSVRIVLSIIGYFFWGSICPLTRDLSLTVLFLLSYSIPVALIIPRGSAIVTALSVTILSSFVMTSRYSLVIVVGPSFAVSDDASRPP